MVTRIFDVLEKQRNEFPKTDALSGKENGVWKSYSTDDFIRLVNDISFGLLSLGLKQGDKVALISGNRPEWNFLDIGLMQVGAIHVPIYPTISEEEYHYILNHAEVKFVFVAGDECRLR